MKGKWYKDKFHLYWLDDNKRIMVIKYVKTYDWLDYYGMMEVAADLVEGIAHPVVYINDFAGTIEIPTRDAVPHYLNMRRMFASPKMVMILRTSQQRHQVNIHSGSVGARIGEDIFLADSFDDAVQIAKNKSMQLMTQHVAASSADR